jgi:hypothetical protein
LNILLVHSKFEWIFNYSCIYYIENSICNSELYKVDRSIPCLKNIFHYQGNNNRLWKSNIHNKYHMSNVLLVICIYNICSFNHLHHSWNHHYRLCTHPNRCVFRGTKSTNFLQDPICLLNRKQRNRYKQIIIHEWEKIEFYNLNLQYNISR